MFLLKARYGIHRFCFNKKNGSGVRNISLFPWMKSSVEDGPKIVPENITNAEIFYLPEPPNAPDIIESLVQYNSLGEATFYSLGLNSYWPTGWVQSGYETLHVSMNLPWWGAIAISAIMARAIMMPITFHLEKLNVGHKEVSPQLDLMERKAKDAYILNDYLTMARTAEQHTKIMSGDKFKPYQIMFFTFLQFPLFLSIMMGLRQMANLPVASLQSGGIFWFTDLTMADPYYILPVCTMVLFWLQMELGADFAATGSSMSPYKKWGIRALPAVGALITCNFPSALLIYWWCSSALSLSIAGAMRIPVLKSAFKIGAKAPDPLESPAATAAKLGFIKDWKRKSAENKIYDTVSKMHSIDNEKWIKAGSGAVPKTFAHDPTKVKSQ